MKKHLYFLLSILISHNALSVDRTWVGTTKERARTTNWSSSGIPDTDDALNIDNPTPTIAPSYPVGPMRMHCACIYEVLLRPYFNNNLELLLDLGRYLAKLCCYQGSYTATIASFVGWDTNSESYLFLSITILILPEIF